MVDIPPPRNLESGSLRFRSEELLSEHPGFKELASASLKMFTDRFQDENPPETNPLKPSPNISQPLENLRYLNNLVESGFANHSVTYVGVRAAKLGDTLHINMAPNDKIKPEDPSMLNIRPGSGSIPQVDVSIRKMTPKDYFSLSAEKAASSGGYVIEVHTTKVAWRRGETRPDFDYGNGVRIFLQKDGACKVQGKFTSGYSTAYHPTLMEIDPEKYGEAINLTMSSVAKLGVL